MTKSSSEIIPGNTIIVDPEFRQYDSISVSPQKYDPDIPSEIYGDPIAKALSSPMSSVQPGDYLCVSCSLGTPSETDNGK